MPMNNRLMRPRAGQLGPGANTLLLLHYDNPGGPGGILKDSSQYNRNIQALTGTAVPSGIARFGSTATGQFSLNMAGAVHGIPVGAGRNVFPDLSQTDHTIECWLYLTPPDPEIGAHTLTIAHFPTYEDLTSTTGQHFYLFGDLLLFNDGAVPAADTSSLPTIVPVPLNAWVHVAAVQQGSCKRIFIDGQLAAYATQSAPAGACSFSTGGYVYYDGVDYSYNNTAAGGVYVDELRVSSRALYTNNFTPPSAPFSTDSPASPSAVCCLPSGYLITASCGGPNGTDIVGEFADGLCGSVFTIIQPDGCA